MKLIKDAIILLCVILGGIVIFTSGCVMMSKKKFDKVILGSMIYGYMQGVQDTEMRGEFNKAL